MSTTDPRFTDSDWSRLARHLTGEADAAEQEAARLWLSQPTTSHVDRDEGMSVWHAVAPLVDEAARVRAGYQSEAGAAFARVRDRRTLDSVPVHRSARRGVRWRQGAAVAAVLVVAAFPVYRAARTRTSWTTYATGPAQRSSLILQDGSRVQLRAQSRLAVQSTQRSWFGRLVRAQGASPRVVRLEGEAVFTVVHDARRPFRVFAGPAVAEDLGTTFSVRAYPDEHQVRVVVSEGAVGLRAQGALGSDSAKAMLSPGDVATVDDAGTIATSHMADASSLDSWTSDRLVFRAQPLKTVINDLNRSFNGKVILGDSLEAETNVTLNIPLRTLEAAVQTLAVLLDLAVEQRADSVVLRRVVRRPAPKRS